MSDPHEKDVQFDLDGLQRQEYGQWKAISRRKYPDSTPDGFVKSRSRSAPPSPATSDKPTTDE